MLARLLHILLLACYHFIMTCKKACVVCMKVPDDNPHLFNFSFYQWKLYWIISLVNCFCWISPTDTFGELQVHPPQRGDYLNHPFIKQKGKEIKAKYSVLKYFTDGTFIMYVMQMDRAYVRSCQYQRIDSLYNQQQNQEQFPTTYKVSIFSQCQCFSHLSVSCCPSNCPSQ